LIRMLPPWRGKYAGVGGNGLEEGESRVEVGVEK
jgi:hypothetical protein